MSSSFKSFRVASHVGAPLAMLSYTALQIPRPGGGSGGEETRAGGGDT